MQALSIYLPAWDVELIRRQPLRSPISRQHKQHAPPLFLTLEASQQERVARCCDSSRRQGVAPGMSVVEARALCPDARMLPFNPTRSRKALDSLAHWATRFSPAVAVDVVAAGGAFPCPDGLLLNVTGTAHLFGGEQLFLAEVVTRLRRIGFSSRVSIAPTIGTAWALSRFGRATLSIVSEEKIITALSPLPVMGLRLSDAICTGLHDVGIRYVGELLKLPRESLLVRYGEEVLKRIDQALGRVNETIEPIRPTEPLLLRRMFEGETTQLEAVLLASQELVSDVTARLLEKESGIRGIKLELLRVGDPPVSREVMLGKPSRNSKHLWSLLRPKVEGLNLGYGVEGIVLTVTWSEKIRHGQQGMWQEGSDDAAAQSVDELVDTLVNRWGEKRVLTPMPSASHVPEFANRLMPITKARKHDQYPVAVPWLDRPSFLFEHAEPAEAVALQPDNPPRLIHWRGDAINILSGFGPERIKAMHDHTTEHRDYFKVQATDGQWLWVYRVWESGKWFVHGLWA